MERALTFGELSFDPTRIDLTNPTLYTEGDPHAVFAWLRNNQPVFRHAWRHGESFIAVTRYSDIVQIYEDPRRFSSARGTLLGGHPLKHDPAGGKMLAMTDPPRHTQLRRLLGRYFTPRVVAGLRQRMADVARECVDAALEAGELDFVQHVAAPLPLAVICEILGIERADWSLLLGLTQRAFGASDPPGQSRAHQEIFLYFLELVQSRRAHPRDDLTTLLATAKVDDVPLTDEEVLLNCDNLLIGGTEAVRHAATGGVLAFIEHPSVWERLPIDAAPYERIVEEVLRWTTPPTHILRTALADCDIGGYSVAAGDVVALWNLSANRDAAAFLDADRFDIDRRENPHLTFGAGHHFCIGAFLARAELATLFAELRRRSRSIELAGPVVRLPSIVTYGFERLSIAVKS